METEQPTITEMVTPVEETDNATSLPAGSQKKRGRPKVNVNWPEGEFTFSTLNSVNVLSSSSLRKKMRTELTSGGLVKVNTLKTAFGRPLNVYKKAT